MVAERTWYMQIFVWVFSPAVIQILIFWKKIEKEAMMCD